MMLDLIQHIVDSLVCLICSSLSAQLRNPLVQQWYNIGHTEIYAGMT